MPKTLQTPASVLNALMEEYQLNPSSLSGKIALSISAVRQIAIGKTGITVPTALRLAKFFGQTPAFWLDLQLQEEMQAAANDKELQTVLKGISKAAKPSAAAKGKVQAKAVQAKSAQAKPAKKTTQADKRKEAAKVPGSKASLRKGATKKGE